MSKQRQSTSPIFCEQCETEYTEEAQDRGEYFAKTEEGFLCELCLEDVIDNSNEDVQYFLNWK